MASNDFFQRMTKEAMNELADGKKSWKEVSPNVLIMAVFGMLTNHLTHKLTKPMWFFASVVAAGVIWYVVSSILGI
ncbi:hypothetical protein LCGC14_0431460 [marine sediment metagenome]|uniref:Uncharacterized protein n=1 Tax=marine sediment metagenome TaxID=412755 RepID=A0A0F9VA81_9ZZZZ